MTVTVSVLSENLTLLPERAVYRPHNQTLYIADTHWGKIATFQANYIPLPQGGLSQDLTRLTQVIHHTRAERLVILGDLIHSKHSSEVTDIINKWRSQHSSLTIQLVQGNHDKKIDAMLHTWHIEQLGEQFSDDGLQLSHKPLEMPTRFTLCGHLHPTWTLEGHGKQTINLPCFMQLTNLLILPAFSQFTGSTTYRMPQLEHVYVSTGKQVIQVR